ncbi:MAG: dienelactone hydrolase family protein [Pseudomonadota bacterium]
MQKTFRFPILSLFTFVLGFLLITNPVLADNAEGSDRLPYAVGSSTFFIYDQSRPYDLVAGVDVGARALITEIWYPVAHQADLKANYRVATYGDYVFGDQEVHRLMMTQTTFFHLTPDSVVEGTSQADIDSAIAELFKRQRNSYVDAPLADGKQAFPVVVMSHGDAGSRYNMETACEYLAAHGYVVIAPEHTGNSPFSQTGQSPEIDSLLSEVKPFLNADGTYGSKEKYGQTYTPLIQNREDPQALTNLDNALLERVNDLRATINELELMNKTGRFAGRLDLSKIGLMGRSFGGTTTLAALGLEPRFTAGVSVVPLVMPDMRPGLPKEMLKPAGEVSVILSSGPGSVLNKISKPTLLLSGAEDALIIGVGAGMAKSAGGVTPSAENPLPALRQAYEDSDQPVIWGLLENSNHGSFGVSGGYWWPALKPSTQERFFAPGETFSLIKPSIAHNIQRSKVLQFFDVMIAGKAAQASLLNNEFSDQGLQYEWRNFP